MSAEAWTAGSAFRCGLCGARFTHGAQVCRACPLRDACDVVQCPNCGYQFPRESRIVSWLRRRFRAGAEER